ncbi:hypothetical protein N8501_01070 [Synechococcus sp. AH-601-N10]|nr:hypothetical protein [Synechococcus sp. AH-601-N10]
MPQAQVPNPIPVTPALHSARHDRRKAALAMASIAESIISTSKTTGADSDGEGEGITTSQAEKVLCPHCRRTASNGIRCMGICVADNDY